MAYFFRSMAGLLIISLLAVAAVPVAVAGPAGARGTAGIAAGAVMPAAPGEEAEVRAATGVSVEGDEAIGVKADARAASLGERFGVASSHIKLYDSATMGREFAAMEDVGAAWLRCDFAWSDLEPTRGAWDFSGSDAVVREAASRGVKALGILGASLTGIFAAALYNYARTGTVPQGFSPEVIAGAFEPKAAGGLFSR